MTDTVLDREHLARQLAEAGLPFGRDVLVHSSLSRVGPIAGGPATVLAALRDVIGPAATVVVPAATVNNSTTSSAFLAATQGMDPVQLAAYVSGMPGFDRANTPSYRMGRLAEHVRTRPAAVRSAHPQSSFAAYGPSAASLMATHDLDCHLGERSPLAALYDANASILLLGVGFDRCTALHLAEHRVPWRPPSRTYRCYVHVDTVGRQTRDFVDVALDASDFDKLGEDLAREPFVTCGVVGNTTAIVLPLVQMVGYAVGWMTTHRQP